MKPIQSSDPTASKPPRSRQITSVCRQAGMTLVEVMAGIVLASILTIGTFKLYGDASESMRVVQAQSDITLLTEAVIRNYASFRNFSSLTTASAKSEGWLPTKLLDSSGQPKNAWGNDLEFGHVDMGQTSSGFTISQRLPSDACVTLAGNMARSFDAVHVENQEVSIGRSPANPEVLARLCGTGDTVVLSLTAAR